MIIAVESIILCVLFTAMCYVMTREPVKMLYNYPPKIRERVESLDEYKDKIPSGKNKVAVKAIASLIFMAVLALMLRFINGYTTLHDGFIYTFALWTIVNLYDLLVLDFAWFCHDPRFIIKGTEDMTKEYHDYVFHVVGFIQGEALALIVSLLVGLTIQFIK